MPARRIGGRIYEEIAVTASTPLPVDIGENITIDVGNVQIGASVEVNNEANNPVPVTGPLTDTQLRTTPVPVSLSSAVTVSSGTVQVSSGVVTVANGAGAPVPVSGPVTDAELRASAISVSGPLTNTQLRASAVPVSGTVAVSNSGFQVTNAPASSLSVSGSFLTNAELRASALPVTSSTPAATPTTTRVLALTTSQLMIGANSSRRGLMVSNISPSKLYLSFSNPATVANAFIEMAPGAFLLLDQQLIMTNAIYGIWTSASGAVQVTEFV